MTTAQFVASRQESWFHLEGILTALREGGGPQALSSSDLDALGRLYRKAASDLAYARAHDVAPETVEYLNQLVVRAHGQIYTPERGRWSRVKEFLVAGFPRLFRQTWPFTAVAVGVTLASASFAYFSVRADPEGRMGVFVPEQVIRMWQDAPDFKRLPGMYSMMASFYMTHNTEVGFMAFAGGITAGVATTLSLLYNGLMVGGLAAAVQDLPGGPHLRLWMVQHGPMELTAIFICGGAGYLLAWAIIAPGDLPRRRALAVNGNKAVQLVLGAVPLFVLAGIIEGFVSPSPLPPPLKQAFGATMTLVVIGYLALGGRRGRTT